MLLVRFFFVLLKYVVSFSNVTYMQYLDFRIFYSMSTCGKLIDLEGFIGRGICIDIIPCPEFVDTDFGSVVVKV